MLARSHPTATIGFWIIAHDTRPQLAIVNRQTWLRGEPHVHVVVDAAANVSAELAPLLEKLRVDCPMPRGDIGKSIEGTHARRGPVEQLGAMGHINVYLRRKVGTMISAMCEAREDFAVMLDEDTAINSTRLREWIRTDGHSPGVPLYAGTQKGEGAGIAIGGGPGIVFSRAGLRALCSAGCEPQSCTDAEIRHCDATWSSGRRAVRADRNGRCNGGDHWVGACAAKANLSAERLEWFTKFPAWTLNDSGKYIGMHRMRPAEGSFDFAPDPRCRIVEEHARRGLLQTHRCAPYFAVIGSPKSGTTSLFDYLLQHPQIKPPRTKELHAFKPVADWAAGTRVTEKSLTMMYPYVDPREFVVTGDASPATWEHSAAAALLRAMRVKCILLLRHPVERSISEYANKDEGMLGTRGRNFRFIPKYIRSFDHLVNETARILALKRRRIEYGGVRFDEPSAWSAFKEQMRGGERLFKCSLDRNCFSPVIYQSWYDVFLPLWAPYSAEGGLRIEFSDEFYGHEARTLQSLTAWLGLPPQAYDVSYVKNNHAARGVIAASNNTRTKATSTATCLSDESALARAQEVMRPSIVATRELLSQIGYTMPRAWARPLRPCRSAPAPADAALAKRSG